MPDESTRKSVLVVGSVSSIRSLLPEEAVEVESARDAGDALSRVMARSYDLVVTDIETPGAQDVELLRQIREVRPAARVILLSSESTPEAVVESMREHAFSYFTKPVDRGTFRELVAKALELSAWDDGIQVLSARPNWITLELRCRQYTADRLLQFFGELKSDLPVAERENIAIAFREMLLNAIEHGGKFDPEKKVQVSYLRTDRVILYYIRDPGQGFSFESLPHAALSNPPEAPAQHLLYRAEHGLRAGGFGMLLAQKLVDVLIHNEKGNEVLLIKYL